MKHLYFLIILLIAFGCTEQIDMPAEPDNPHVVTTTSPTGSAEVSIDRARADLISLMQILDTPDTRADIWSPRVIENEYELHLGDATRNDDSDTKIYIFNFANEEGFAMMSADTRLPSLLAFSQSGNYEMSTRSAPYIPTGFDMFDKNLQEMVKEVTDVDGNPLLYTVPEEWETIVYKYRGYCPVKWGQENPYNAYCPEIDGSNAVTGCVATAVAQLMSIYEYPLSYYCSSEKKSYSFAWDKMTASPSASLCDSEGKESIGQLMRLLGLSQNLNMNYGVSASGAQDTNAIKTLKNFSYSNGGTYDDYETATVTEELKAGYGILISGASYSDGSMRHMWLAHGLLERKRNVKVYQAGVGYLYTKVESYWYPLCNWGWDGKKDGYYLSDVFEANNGCAYGDNTRGEETYVEGESLNFAYYMKTITNIRM